MQYRLKDTGLQKKLDELSDGDFSRQLEVNKGHIIMGIEYSEQATIWFCKTGGPLLSIEITPDMLEKVPEYDPHKWNKYPDVTPPANISMRCECKVSGREYRKGAYFRRLDDEGGAWFDIDGHLVDGVYRFRPWVGPEEEHGQG